MNLSTWFTYLAFGCIACSRPSTTPTPSIEGPNRVTALLNDSTWFGSAYVSKTIAIAGQSACTSNRFNIGFSTDLPYDNNPSKKTVTGCSGDCVPTQVLAFHNIPLAIGKYEISTLNSCARQYTAVEYFWLVGGDVVINTYNSQNSKAGWIEVTDYNANENAIEGTFEVELVNQTSKTARFQKGVFKALIK